MNLSYNFFKFVTLLVFGTIIVHFLSYFIELYSRNSTKMVIFVLPERLPKLIVFDLDYTLWPMYVDTDVTPPVSRDKHGNAVDATGYRVKPYQESTLILKSLHEAGQTLAVASRSPTPPAAEQVLHSLDWNKFFKFKEIYPGSKITHFRKLQRDSGFDFSEMIFFDDEQRNIREVSSLGVTCIHIKDRISVKLVQKALNDFSARMKP